MFDGSDPSGDNLHD
jgi:hypothetical protein